jgi:hypothetical protein
MPGIGLRKLWILQVFLRVVWSRLCPTDGQCRHAGAGLTGRSSEAFRNNVSRAAELLLGIRSTTDVELVHLVLERCSLQAEALCGSALAGDSPRDGFQGLDDDLPLSLLES